MALAVFAAFLFLLFVFWVTRGSRRPKTRGPAPGEAPYELGVNAIVSGDRDAAVRHLAAAVRQDPRNVDAYIKLGNLLRERGQIRQATQIHRELLLKRRLPPTTKNEILTCLALDLAEERRWGEVLEAVRSLGRSERADPRMLALARDAYESTGDLDHAVQTHRELLKAAPGRGEPPLGVYRAHAAVISLRQGDLARAKAELQAAVNESPEAAAANVYLGDIANEEGDRSHAIATWMRVLAEKPDCGHLVFERLEKAFYDTGDFGRMMGVYEDVVSRAPTNARALCGLARMYERKGSIDDAVRTAQEAVKHEGATLVGHRELLGILVRNGSHAEAARVALSLVKRLSEEGAPSRCPSCRKTVAEGDWRCPHCRAWTHAC